MNVDYESFNDAAAVYPHVYPLHGKLRNFNTVESFRDCDKQAATNEEASEACMVYPSID